PNKKSRPKTTGPRRVNGESGMAISSRKAWLSRKRAAAGFQCCDSITIRRLMAKMPDPGEDHGQAVLIASGDRFRIADRAAGLDDGADAGAGGLVHVV